MGTSYLLLLCTVHKNIEIADTIRKFPGVKEAIPVIGAYDCVVKTEMTSPDDVNNLVLTSIRPLAHVRSVLTLHDAPKLLLSENA
ncbi:Lrp/AsnC ligand binding domain-containing protein [Nitrosopumilus sp.]|uniref:Lrp/AsnC ligand binding domain-containing protein n=1 Tax=Nitrosopumilus sp. TaxID=2024843 RepID=UPI00247CA0CE|nr:Lrp/AsnC ligand binding domain-containing protein [Nitrosopumilus sp.]MCV0411354.1 Lrp/AsnC ligand binding domain-containing protein [Nitrosopumilus sp.]